MTSINPGASITTSSNLVQVQYDNTSGALTAAGQNIGATIQTTTAAATSRLWDKLRRGYEARRFNNPHVLGIMTSPPTVTLLATIPPQNTNNYPCLAPSGNFSAQMYATGGTPFFRGPGLANSFGFPSTSVSNAGSGNIVSNLAAMAWRVQLIVDAIDPVFQLVNSANGARFVVITPGVGAQYVSITPTVPSNGGANNWIQLTFGSRASREIWIEGIQALSLIAVGVRANETVIPVPTGLRMTFIGDSIVQGTIGGGGYNGDGFALVMGDCLGVSDVRMSGIGGQGVQAIETGGTWNLPARLTPAINANAFIYDAPPSDVIVFAMGVNDTPFSYASNIAAYVSCIRQLIGQYPTTPIVVIGCPGNNSGPQETNATTDFAIAAAVASIGSSNIVYIQDASLGQYCYETGTGNITTPTSGVITANATLTAATSCTLTAGFPGPTGSYTLTFADGTQKQVTGTLSNSALSWSGAVTPGSTTIYYSGQAASKTLTASVAAGATSATLSSGFGFTTGTWLVSFSTGETRLSTITNGTTALSWTNPLLFAATLNVYVSNQVTCPGNNDIGYNAGDAVHPAVAGHLIRGRAYADALYGILKGL
jgi:hypothetical protein